VRAGGRLLAGTVALLLMVQAGPRLIAGLLIAPHEPTVRLVERHNPPSREDLLDARRAYEGALAWYDGAEEWRVLAGLRLVLALQLGTDTAQGQAMLDSARQTVRTALAHAPSDPYLWAELAEAEQLTNGFGPAFVAALHRSIATGPFEPTLVAFRANVGLDAWLALAPATRDLVKQQIRAAALLQPAELRQAAQWPLRRRLIEEALADRPDLYARFQGDSP
jgi:hypothetical protein